MFETKLQVYKLNANAELFYILIGSNMKIAYFDFGDVHRRHFMMERFNDDGSRRSKKYNDNAPIGDIRKCKWGNIDNALVKLPVTYR